MTLKVLLVLASLLATSVCAEVRLDCLLNENDITEAECIKRECHYNRSTLPHVPFCYLDTTKVGYNLKAAPVKRTNGQDATLVLNPAAHKSLPSVAPLGELKLEINYLSEHIVRVRITDPVNKRYEVPIQSEFNIPNEHPNSTKYEVTLGEHFNLAITRKESGVKVIDTSIGGLIYSDKFIQFATNLATENIYGVGETYHTQFKHDLNYHTFPLFTRERVMREKERNNYGVHPFYTVAESDGRAHGIFLLNSNAMAYTMLPGPAVSIKTTGGILDFFVILGDNPEHVVKLYTSIIGRSVMPPFWGMGFQLTRYGVDSIDYYKKVINRNIENGVPVDIQTLEIDTMEERKDFRYDQVRFKGLPEYMKEMKAKHNLRWIVNISPVIEADKVGYTPFDEGYKRDVFVKWSNSTPAAQRANPKNVPTDKLVFYGHMWPHGPVAWPDFWKNVTRQWWIEQIAQYHKVIEFDAVWNDMNEPVNFPSELHCPDDGLGFSMPSQNFPEGLNTYTICMGAVQGEHQEYRHYDVHSLYGLSETKTTLRAMREITGKRSFVLSRSTYVSSGKYVAHWFGDNFSTWEHLKQSIVSLLEFSLFGMSFTGAEVCGYNGEATPDICRRWYQLGAWYPFFRTHNDQTVKKDKDPAYFIEAGHPEVTKSAITAMRTRYRFMHHLYSLFYRSHVFGETLARPMHHEFPHDAKTRAIDSQFLLGSNILVVPFLQPNQTENKVYVPTVVEWFTLTKNFAEKLNNQNASKVIFLDEFSDRPILLRSGSIFPVIADKSLPKQVNTVEVRKAPIELWILPNKNGSARGELFYDDGESIDTIENGVYNLYEFEFEKCQLKIQATHSGFKAPAAGTTTDILRINTIQIAVPNLKHQTLQVTLDGTTHLNSTLIGHDLKIDVNIDLLQSKPLHTLTVLATTSNECIFSL